MGRVVVLQTKTCGFDVPLGKALNPRLPSDLHIIYECVWIFEHKINILFICSCPNMDLSNNLCQKETCILMFHKPFHIL